MKISHIRISNFRCFGETPITIDLEKGLTALVGNNGSGKTAVFFALSRLFGTNAAQRTIRKSDFHVPPAVTDLPSGAMLWIECFLSFPELEGEGESSAVPDVFSHMAASGEGQPLTARMALSARWIDDGTPEGSVEEELKWITAADDNFEWDECKRVQPVERAYIQIVYVPANRNASDQVTGLLKGRLWRAALWSEQLGTTTAESAQSIQDQFDSEAPARFITERLEKRWQQVHEADTDSSPILRLVESRLDDLVRRAEFVFFPDESGRVRKLEDLSDGQRSLFHIALTAATLEIERDALMAPADATVFEQEKLRRIHLTILAIEEPENSLSPFFLSRIMTQAREIAGMDTAQVVVSSHSPSILSRIEPEEVRYCRLDRPTRSSNVRKLTLPATDSEAGRYVRLAVRAYPELYFARFVVLAEGDSERIVIPRIAEVSGLALDPSFVPIVPLGGRFVTHFWRLLHDLQIPYATLLDLDLGRKHGGAAALRRVVGDLQAIGNDMSLNASVLLGEVDPSDMSDIEDSELLEQEQEHPWLKALRLEGVFFSAPIDLDFLMICFFQDAYKKPRPGGHGPHTDAASVAAKKASTLKTGGKPELYDDTWDHLFAWYPYLFLAQSKPETHMAALSEITAKDLAENAPPEIIDLIEAVRKSLAA